MGTGSEPSQMTNLRKNVAGSVPVPFFHGAPASPAAGGTVSPPEKGDRHRRQHELLLSYRSSTEPVPIFGLPHLRFESFSGQARPLNVDGNEHD